MLLPLLLLAACAQKLGMPSAAPTGEQAPVTLRNIQVANLDGHRAVLLRLSRMPTLVRHSSARHPAQIVVQAWGPTGDDLSVQTLPPPDAQISRVRVSRRAGALTVALDLPGDDPPPYTVQEMADWIMIRFSGATGGSTESGYGQN